MLSSDPVKNSGCNVMEVVERVAKESLKMNAIEKHHLTRSIIAANLPLDMLSAFSIAIHASRETISFISGWRARLTSSPQIRKVL
jgi:hypothetical protein